jgi:hypothetical protein
MWWRSPDWPPAAARTPELSERGVFRFIRKRPEKISGSLVIDVTFAGQRQRLGCVITSGEIFTCGRPGRPFVRVYLDSAEDLRTLTVVFHRPALQPVGVSPVAV